MNFAHLVNTTTLINFAFDSESSVLGVGISCFESRSFVFENNEPAMFQNKKVT